MLLLLARPLFPQVSQLLELLGILLTQIVLFRPVGTQVVQFRSRSDAELAPLSGKAAPGRVGLCVGASVTPDSLRLACPLTPEYFTHAYWMSSAGTFAMLVLPKNTSALS